MVGAELIKVLTETTNATPRDDKNDAAPAANANGELIEYGSDVAKKASDTLIVAAYGPSPVGVYRNILRKCR